MAREKKQLDFSASVTKYSFSLKPFALSLTKNMEDAEDLLQETLFRALSSKDKYTDGTNLKAWMYTIMKNIFINNYRRNKKRSTIIDTTEDMHYLNSTEALDYNKAENDLGMENVMGAIELISEDFRVPFLMHYQGFKYHEIADHLTLPIGTVKSRIHFARKILQKKLNRF